MKSRCLFLILAFLLQPPNAVNSARAAEMPNGKKGVVTGLVASKGQHWIEVMVDGGIIKRYIPFGGLPEDGKDYDPSTVDQIRQIRIGDRVELQWEFQKYLRLARIKSLGRPK